jgi:hypothetical protein
MPTIRYDVTPYADMHCGHIWPAWRAYMLSRRLGVGLLLQFDDDAYTRRNIWCQSWSLEHAEERFLEDFAWLGIEFTDVKRVSEHQDAAEAAAKTLGMVVPEPDAEACTAGVSMFGTDPVLSADQPLNADANVIGMNYFWSDLLHMVADHENRVLRLVRGMDLHYKSGIYAWLWHRLYGGYPPQQHYERLVTRAHAKCSKSNVGGISVRELRDAGYAAREVLDTIRALAKQSAEAYARDIDIPEGVLDPDTHGTIAFDEAWQLRTELVAQEQMDDPWTDDACAAIAREIEAVSCSSASASGTIE